ncbi:MAG: hypothetical protein GF411_02815 [Candidatus Lokiarchaeota archaeon]|nr:hypothetical protein [Candidatus Lokiarchaeota archaeon]
MKFLNPTGVNIAMARGAECVKTLESVGKRIDDKRGYEWIIMWIMSVQIAKRMC